MYGRRGRAILFWSSVKRIADGRRACPAAWPQCRAAQNRDGDSGYLNDGGCRFGSGIIGFVGLVVPHLVRLMVGHDYRILLPLSTLYGAIFMIGADVLARTLIAPAEIPVGIITAFVGAPFFIFLLRRNKRLVL